MLYTYREDHDNPEDSFVAGAITEDIQQPTLIQDNPAYITTMNTQSQIPLSSNPAYSAVYKDSQQPVLKDKPVCLPTNRSVVSLDMIGKESNNYLLFVLVFRIGSASQASDEEYYYYS